MVENDDAPDKSPDQRRQRRTAGLKHAKGILVTVVVPVLVAVIAAVVLKTTGLNGTQSGGDILTNGPSPTGSTLSTAPSSQFSTSAPATESSSVEVTPAVPASATLSFGSSAAPPLADPVDLLDEENFDSYVVDQDGLYHYTRNEVVVAGRPVQNSLQAHTSICCFKYATVQINLGRNFTTLSVLFGIDDKSLDNKTPTMFSISLDGKNLAPFKLGLGDSKTVPINVSGVTRMTIKLDGEFYDTWPFIGAMIGR